MLRCLMPQNTMFNSSGFHFGSCASEHYEPVRDRPSTRNEIFFYIRGREVAINFLGGFRCWADLGDFFGFRWASGAMQVRRNFGNL